MFRRKIAADTARKKYASKLRQARRRATQLALLVSDYYSITDILCLKYLLFSLAVLDLSTLVSVGTKNSGHPKTACFYFGGHLLESLPSICALARIG